MYRTLMCAVNRRALNNFCKCIRKFSLCASAGANTFTETIASRTYLSGAKGPRVEALRTQKELKTLKPIILCGRRNV